MQISIRCRARGGENFLRGCSVAWHTASLTVCATLLLLAAVQATHLHGRLAADLAKHNSPSEYSFRSTAASHAQLMRDLLGTGHGKLPEDFWSCLMQRAGHSQASNSLKTHFDNYTGTLFFDAASRAALAAAVEQCELYAANPTTHSIYQGLISCVQEAGSFAGMLQHRGAGPLLHSGYALPPFQNKVDLAWVNMTPAEAQVYDNGLLQRINAANCKLFGGLQAPPSRPVLLQNMVDLWCADWDAIKLSFAAPAAQGEATAAAASAAVLSALLSGAQVAQAMGGCCSWKSCSCGNCFGRHSRHTRAAAAGPHSRRGPGTSASNCAWGQQQWGRQQGSGSASQLGHDWWRGCWCCYSRGSCCGCCATRGISTLC